MDNINRLKSIITGFLLSITNAINSINYKRFLLGLFTRIRHFSERIIKIKIVQGALLAIPFFIGFIIFHSYAGDELGVLPFGLLYIGICALTWSLPENKFFNFIKIAVAIPYIIGIFILPFIELFFLLMVTVFTPLTVIALFIDKVPEAILGIDLLFNTKLYLMLIISSILISLFAEIIIVKFITYWNRTKSDERVSKRVEFTLGLINSGVIKYSIYFLFCLSLFVFSIAKFNQIDIFEDRDIVNVILTSFATFIAFDRLTLNKNLININPKRMFKKLLNLWQVELEK